LWVFLHRPFGLNPLDCFPLPKVGMTSLWFAFGIYILGVGLVLFFRPSLMFQEGAGVWKEFGIGTSGQRTVFPFWLFTIVWALVSYVIATLFSVYVATLSLRSESNAFLQPISQVTPATATAFPPAIETPSLSSKVPGYYILESAAAEAPRYVYFGSEPPTPANLAAAARSPSRL
jgi:hypothetical protein